MRGFGDMHDTRLEPPDECDHDIDVLCRKCDPEGYTEYIADLGYAERRDEG